MLPQDLSQALDALRADEVMCTALGNTLVEQFLLLKTEEWTQYRQHVSDWELQRYACMF